MISESNVNAQGLCMPHKEILMHQRELKRGARLKYHLLSKKTAKTAFIHVFVCNAVSGILTFIHLGKHYIHFCKKTKVCNTETHSNYTTFGE